MKKRILILHFLLAVLTFTAHTQVETKNDKAFERGLKYVKKYQRADAESIFTEIIKEDPEYVNAYYERAKINKYYKNDSLAILDYTIVANKSDSTEIKIEAHSEILELLFKNEDSCSSTAESHILILKELDAENYKGTLYNGICKLHSGEAQEAVNELTKAYNLNHEDKSTLYFRALAEIEIENYITAIEDLTKVIAVDPKDGNSYFWRAYAYYELGIQPKEKHSKKYLALALDDLDLAIKFKVRVEAAYFDRAEVKFELGDYEGAIADFKKVLAKNPRNMDARYQKALCYYHYGNVYYAIKDLKYIVKKDTAYVDAFYDLAVIYHQKDQLGVALSYANKTVNLDKEHADAYLVRGLIKVDQGKEEGACNDFKKAATFGDIDVHHVIKKYCK